MPRQDRSRSPARRAAPALPIGFLGWTCPPRSRSGTRRRCDSVGSPKTRRSARRAPGQAASGRGATRHGGRDRARPGAPVGGARADRVSWWSEATPSNRRPRVDVPVHIHSRTLAQRPKPRSSPPRPLPAGRPPSLDRWSTKACDDLLMARLGEIQCVTVEGKRGPIHPFAFVVEPRRGCRDER